MENLEQLKEFKIKYGHCEVWLEKGRNDPLTRWVVAQRSAFSIGEIGPERKGLLDAIGFTWSGEVADLKWREMYERLEQYYAKHGNADIPDRWKEDPNLAKWVQNQRKRRKNNRINITEIQLLNDLGFTWESRDRGTWEDRLEEVAAFKAKYGHCDIPVYYPDNPKLGQFVNNTRSQRKAGMLSADRIAKLKAIGFVWVSTNNHRIGKDGMNGAWKSRFDDLLCYKQTYGDCDVPYDWDDNTPLANWVHAQRSLKNNGKLHPERARVLEEIGFNWEPTSSRQPWEDRYAELLEFKRTHGNCDLPTNYVANPALGKWVSRQRQNKKAGKLSIEQIRLLNEAGFIWEKKPT